MADSGTQELTNKVTISDAGPSRKKVSIEIPSEAVEEKLKESFDTIAVEAELPGFRKGRVPRSLVEKRFGSAVKTEAKNQLVAAAYTKAIEDNKLKVVGEPTAEGLDKLELELGKPLKIDLEVEVMPEFDLPKLDGITVKRPTLEVTSELVDEEFKKLQINEGSLESREATEPGDYLTGHAVMTGPDKKEFYNLKGAVVQAPTQDKNGKGMILGIMVEDFSKQLGAPKPGDEVTIKAKGPEQHEVEGIRNADLTVTFKVERIDRIIPATGEQLSQMFGLEDEAKVKEFLRTRLEQNVQSQQASAMRAQVSKHLVDNTKMDLPERITANQAARTLERRRLELMYRGVDPQKIEEHMAELRASSNEVAARDLKLFFVLNKAAEDMDIKVTDGEINGRIVQMAYQRNVRPEKLRQEIIQNNQVGGIYQQIRDHKTLDAIVAKASVEDISADEYNKMAKDLTV